MIVQELHKLQSAHGYLPRAELRALSHRLALPLYRLHEVASFFPHFRVFSSDAEEARAAPALPQVTVAVCRDMACRLRGSGQYLQALSQAAGGYGGQVEVCGVSCLGRCDRAPAVRITTNRAGEHAGHQVRALLGRPLAEVNAVVCAVIEGNTSGLPDDRDSSLPSPQPPTAWRIDSYAGQSAETRYGAVRRFAQAAKSPATRQQETTRILQALEAANLLGMGGAGGRTYKKWAEVLDAVGERKFVICNGDESEPGTFKDREILLRTPHLVVEGVILAGMLLAAERGYLYIRHEYEEAIESLEKEIAWARQHTLCGENILGSGMSFDLEVFVSPGGYICGEQTALVQAIQDERAEPRNRPPELQTNGLWNMPTLLNNVETFAWVPAILNQPPGDGRWYAALGAAAEYRGARFFSVSGDVQRPGAYEVPIGITLGELIDDYCGGIAGGGRLKAVALSGPSGGFLPASLPIESFSPGVRQKAQQLAGEGASELDLRRLPLDLGVARQLRLMLGAAIIVYAEGADLVDQALACLKFYQAESCGKCVPCRIGTTKMVEICEDLVAGRLTRLDIEQLKDRHAGQLVVLAQTMADTAICGLGTSAPNPFKSLLAYFPAEVERYLNPYLE